MKIYRVSVINKDTLEMAEWLYVKARSAHRAVDKCLKKLFYIGMLNESSTFDVEIWRVCLDDYKKEERL